MAVIDEIIRLESDNSLSFGNYSVSEKQKVNNFEALGDIYKVKTHNQITRLEKNGKLLVETVPGATIRNLKISEKRLLFQRKVLMILKLLLNLLQMFIIKYMLMTLILER